MAQRDGRPGSQLLSGWNLLFVHVADLGKRCVERQKRFASPFICPFYLPTNSSSAACLCRVRRVGSGDVILSQATITDHPQIAWAKLRALRDGAAIASKKLCS